MAQSPRVEIYYPFSEVADVRVAVLANRLWDAVSNDFLNMVGLGDPKKNPEGALQNIGARRVVLRWSQLTPLTQCGCRVRHLSLPEKFPVFPKSRSQD